VTNKLYCGEVPGYLLWVCCDSIVRVVQKKFSNKVPNLFVVDKIHSLGKEYDRRPLLTRR
jgi:hypothetical protein